MGIQASQGNQARRIGLMLVLVAAAMPIRFPITAPIANSISVLDVALILGGVTIYFRGAAERHFRTGDPWLFRLLALPLVVTLLSLLSSQDVGATIRLAIIYLEGLIAYAFVVKETDGLRPEQVLTYMKRFVYLLIIPGILLLLHVPGFAPQGSTSADPTLDPVLDPASGDYLSYFSRLSHPILGRSNNLATVLAFFVLPLLFWGARNRMGRFSRAGIVAFIAVILTFSRGVILALLLAGFLYWITGFNMRSKNAPGRRSAPRVIGVVTLAAIAGALFYYLNPTANLLLVDRLNTATVLERPTLIGLGFQKIGESPWLGFGGGVVPDNDPLLTLTVHNTFVQQMLYFGIPLGLIVGFSLLLIARFFFVHAKRQEIGRVLGFAVLLELLIFAFESSYEGTVLKVLFYLSVGLGAGLLRAAEAGRTQQADESAHPQRDVRIA